MKKFKSKFYKTILKYGHAGVGRFQEITRVIIARNLNEALEITQRLPGVKKTKGMAAVEKIEQIKDPLGAFRIVIEDEVKQMRKHLKQRLISPAIVHKFFEIAFQFSW